MSETPSAAPPDPSTPPNPSPPPKKRRVFRIVWRVLLGLLALAVVVAAVGYIRVRQKLRGPPVPLCAGEAPPRALFEKPIQLTSPKSPGTYGNEPGVALLPSGSVAVAYQAMNGFMSENGLGVLVVSPDGKVEERPYRSERKRHFDAWMDVDPAGKLHLVWLGHDGGGDERAQIAYATSENGLDWSAPVRVDDREKDCPNDMPGCVDKSMVVALRDAVLVFYYSTPAEGLVAVRVSDGGKTVSRSVKAGGGAYGSAFVTPREHVYVVFIDSWSETVDQYGDVGLKVVFIRSEDGGKTFSEAVRISDPGEPVPFYFSNPAIAVDEARGLIYGVYPRGLPDGRWDIVLATSRDGGKSFTRIQVNDDASCANHMTPAAVLDPRTGTLHVIWVENRGGQGRVAYAACEPGGARCSANESVSEAPFASYSFARHHPDWIGEYPALRIDPERRLLHAVWAQPVNEDGDPVSRLMYARARLLP